MNDELLIKFLLKETSEEENAEVQNWIAFSADNTTYFTQLSKIWNASGDIKEDTVLDESEAWLKFKSKADQIPVKKQVVVKQLKQSIWLKIAALFVLGLSIWTVYSLFGNSTYQDVFSGDKVISQILPDGSELTINKNSEISFAKNFKSNRSIHLKKGDVFFNVAHDKNNPFVIEIDEVSVKVVGTSFNIKHLKDETEIIVESGIVKVNLGAEEIELIKGERIRIQAGAKKLIKKQSDNQLYNYYRTKLFVAQDTPMSELIAILNEAYGGNVVLADDVKDSRIFITLELDSLEKNLKYICDVMKLKISRNQHEILLSY